MISVCTAVHDVALPMLQDLYSSLLRQTYTDWEWVLAYDGVKETPRELRRGEYNFPVAMQCDKRVRVYTGCPGQASCKALSFDKAEGEWLVRIDADDILPDRALEHLSQVDAGFAYGNFARFGHGTWDDMGYHANFGWRHKPYNYRGHQLWEHIQWPLGPLMTATLYFAPSCFLAWRPMAYDLTGGFWNEPKDSPEHGVVARTYIELGEDGMVHIPECLYLYRYHPESTSMGRIPGPVATKIHTNAYWQYIYPCYHRWCQDRDYRIRHEGVEAGDEGQVGVLHCEEITDWDWVFEAMAPGGLVATKTKCDSRFHQYTAHEDGTRHCFCLKPPYDERPVGLVKNKGDRHENW